MELLFIKQIIRRDAGMTTTFIKRVTYHSKTRCKNVLDLGYLRVEKDFSEQLSALPYRKKRN
jgi:hypothetical protein